MNAIILMRAWPLTGLSASLHAIQERAIPLLSGTLLSIFATI